MSANMTPPQTATTGDGQDWLTFAQTQVNEAQARLNAADTWYNVQIQRAQEALAAAGDDPGAATAANQQLQGALDARNQDRQIIATYAPQVSQELTRRVNAAKAQGGDTALTPKEQAALDKQIALLDKQTAQIQAQMAADAAKAKADALDASDPTKKKAVADALAAQTFANNAAADANEANAAYQNIKNQFTADELAAANEKARLANDEQRRILAAGGPEAGVRSTNAVAGANEAQAAASAAATDVSKEDLHQKQIGELGTYAEQLQKQVDAGVLTRDQARSMLQAKSDELATGATAYTRQSQTAANSLAFAQEAQRQGTLVNMGQQYATGAEPGGAYSQMSEALGFGPVSQQLHPTPLPQAIQALGADVNTPYTTAQLGMPAPNLPGPAPTSADSFTYSSAVQAGAGPPPAVQGLGTAQIDWSALTFQQAKALLRGGGQPTPQQPPVQSVPVVNGAGSGVPTVGAGRR